MFSDFIVSLDMGTANVSVLIAELNEDGAVRIIGAGKCVSEGIKKSVVINIEDAAECVLRARAEAEKMAGVEIQGVCAGISGPDIRSFNSRGIIEITDSRREVTVRDVKRATEAARSITLPADREVIQTVPQHFMVDKQSGIKDPIGMSASRLGAEVHIVTDLGLPVENFIKVLKRAGLEIFDLVFTPLAAAQAVLSVGEMEAGCLLVDVGGGVTSYALYYGGCARSSGVVAAGGINITKDLAIGLRIPSSAAEDLKRVHGVALTSMAGEDETIEVPGGQGQNSGKVRKQIIAAIVEPRCEEIFAMVKESVSSDPFYRMLGGGIVLTGGGSIIKGMDGVAEQVFDLPVRKGRPYGLEGLSELVSSESWSAGVGLLIHAAREAADDAGEWQVLRRFRSIFEGVKRFAGWFKLKGVNDEVRVR